MKKSKRNYVIIALVVILLALAIGYASFSSILTVNGTATGTGQWDVKFTSAKFLDSAGAVDTGHGDQPTISAEGDTITAEVKLAYPGDGVILEAVVTNSGNVPAKLEDFKVTGGDEDLVITQSSIATNEKLSADGGTCTAQFAIVWSPESEKTELGEKTFTITYTYTQDTTNVTLNPTHTDA